jgi:hypothetical protein
MAANFALIMALCLMVGFLVSLPQISFMPLDDHQWCDEVCCRSEKKELATSIFNLKASNLLHLKMKRLIVEIDVIVHHVIFRIARVSTVMIMLVVVIQTVRQKIAVTVHLPRNDQMGFMETV